MWGNGESKLHSVSSCSYHSHHCAIDKPPGNPPKLSTWGVFAIRRATRLLRSQPTLSAARSGDFPRSEVRRTVKPSACYSESESSRSPNTRQMNDFLYPTLATWVGFAHVQISVTCVLLLEYCTVTNLMAFPRRALASAAVIGVLLYLLGVPIKAAIGICFFAFLASGGTAYLKLFFKTFPRDLWYASLSLPSLCVHHIPPYYCS